MIKIERYNLQHIAERYFSMLNDWRLNQSNSRLSELAKIPVQQFRELILCPPGKLGTFIDQTGIDTSVFPPAYGAFFYNKFVDGATKENVSYWLSRQLNVRVCPYCNRTYTFTVKKCRNGKVTRVRPEFDHFYPKSNPRYRHLALSFYNLIPSCQICNHVKIDHLIEYHPYIGSVASGGEPYFEVQVSGTQRNDQLFPENPVVLIKNPDKNTQVLALDELYKVHTDYVKELLDKIQAYNHSLYDPLISSFQMSGKTADYIDRLIWGTSVDTTQFDKRPLSKLTHDILHQFDII